MNESLQLVISISVYQPQQGGRLEIREDLTLKPASFMELCKILGQFSELADKIKREQR